MRERLFKKYVSLLTADCSKMKPLPAKQWQICGQGWDERGNPDTRT